MIQQIRIFLENAFPYMDNYNYHKGMKGIIQELKCLLKTKSISLLDQFNLLHINDSIPQIANYALIFPEDILLTLFFLSMNTIFTYFRICENFYK